MAEQGWKDCSIEVFDPKARSCDGQKRFTDYSIWRKFAEERAQIEDQFCRRTIKWTAAVRRELANIKTYKDPNLAKSLELELAFSSLRADQAERNSMAFTRLARHLERELVQVKSDEYKGQIITYKQLLKTLDKVSTNCQHLHQKLQNKRKKLAENFETIAQLDESKQGVAPELQSNVKGIRTQLENLTRKCRTAQRVQSTVADEAIAQSKQIKFSWIQMEVQRSEFLVKEWLKCLTDKMATIEYDVNEYEGNAAKMTDSVSVREMVERMAEQNHKKITFREMDAGVDFTPSVTPVLSPIIPEVASRLPSNLSTDMVIRLNTSAEERENDKLVKDGSFHRPSNYREVEDQVDDSTSIEKIDCRNGRQIVRCSGTSMKTFLPEELVTPQYGQGDGSGVEIPTSTDKIRQKIDPFPVVVVKDYKKKEARDISIRCGQKLDVCSMVTCDDKLFGFKKCRLTGREKGGYFPADCVVPY